MNILAEHDIMNQLNHSYFTYFFFHPPKQSGFMFVTYHSVAFRGVNHCQ